MYKFRLRVVGKKMAGADICWEAVIMTMRARKRSSRLFIRFLSIIAAVIAWQLVLSCAEGGGTGLIEQYPGDATVVQDTGPPPETGFCGDGKVNVAGEQCDGTDLAGMTCGQLGMGTGDLACFEANCVFDTSMCHEEEPVAGGAGGSYGGTGGV
jgi:hypothetical protein